MSEYHEIQYEPGHSFVTFKVFIERDNNTAIIHARYEYSYDFMNGLVIKFDKMYVHGSDWMLFCQNNFCILLNSSMTILHTKHKIVNVFDYCFDTVYHYTRGIDDNGNHYLFDFGIMIDSRKYSGNSPYEYYNNNRNITKFDSQTINACQQILSGIPLRYCNSKNSEFRRLSRLYQKIVEELKNQTRFVLNDGTIFDFTFDAFEQFIMDMCKAKGFWNIPYSVIIDIP